MLEHRKSEKVQNSQWGKKSIIQFSINSVHFLKLLLCFWFVSVTVDHSTRAQKWGSTVFEGNLSAKLHKFKAYKCKGAQRPNSRGNCLADDAPWDAPSLCKPLLSRCCLTLLVYDSHMGELQSHAYIFSLKSPKILVKKYTFFHIAVFNMHLKPALSPIIFRRATVQYYYTLTVLNLLNVFFGKHFSALTRDGEMHVNSKALGGLL